MTQAFESSSTPTPPDPSWFDALVKRPEIKVFKQDRRCRVWLAQDDTGKRWVVKRFATPSLRQSLQGAVGRHPVQREVLWQGRLQAAGFAVAPISDQGVDDKGRRYIVTPYLGPTLSEVLPQTPPLGAKRRHGLTRQVGALVGRLLALRLYYRNLKTASLVVADDGRVVLIGVGDCRGSKGTPLLAVALGMLEFLHRDVQGLGPDGMCVTLSRADRLRFYRAMLAAWPSPPDGLQHLLRHPEFEKRYA